MSRCFMAVGLLLLVGNALSATSDEIQSLLAQGKITEAYQEGKRHTEDFGEPKFDFYFGIAAIDAGHAGEGVLALERYLLGYPDNVSALLQLARGYFILGEDARAREEFEALRSRDPPADVAATIDRYLAAIKVRESRYTPSAGFYIEAGIGKDSNVNAGVANADIFLPNLGNIIVAPGGTKTSDTFSAFGAGGYGSYPIAPGIALFGNGQADLKLDHSSSQFNLGNYNASGGVSILREKNLFRFGLNDSLITLDDTRYRTYLGGSGEWQHQLDERQSLSGGIQAGRIHYPGPNSTMDADFSGLTAGYRHLFTHPLQPLFTAAVNVGREQTLAPGRDDLARHFYGSRLGISLTPAAKWGVSAGYTFLNSRYLAPDLILGTAREDRYGSIDALLSYLYSPALTLRLEASSSRNRSNIALYTFPQDIVAVKMRYEFK